MGSDATIWISTISIIAWDMILIKFYKLSIQQFHYLYNSILFSFICVSLIPVINSQVYYLGYEKTWRSKMEKKKGKKSKWFLFNFYLLKQRILFRSTQVCSSNNLMQASLDWDCFAFSIIISPVPNIKVIFSIKYWWDEKRGELKSFQYTEDASLIPAVIFNFVQMLHNAHYISFYNLIIIS